MSAHKRAYYENLLSNPNIQAYLLTIRKGEGTLGKEGYSTHFGGGTIETLSKNPTIGKKWTAGKYTSSAVGAFQFLNSLKHPTWPNIASRFGFRDFSPRNQDIGALYLIDEKNALLDIIDGNIASAIEKTKGVWASLPGSKYGQPTQKLKDALAFYKNHGGNIGRDSRKKAQGDSKISTQPKIAPHEVLPPEFSHFKNWPLADIVTKRPTSASRNHESMSASRLQGSILVPIPISKPTKGLPGTTHNKEVAANTITDCAVHHVDKILELQSSIVGKSFKTDGQYGREGQGYQSKMAFHVDPMALQTDTGIPHFKKEIKFPPHLSYLRSIWSAPDPDVGSNILIDRKSTLLKPVQLLDDAKSTGKGFIPLRKLPIRKGENIKFQGEDRKSKDRDSTLFEAPGSEAEKENYQGKVLPAGSSHEANVVNINLSSLIGSFTVNTTSPSGGIDNLKDKVEEALLEVINSANSIQ